MRSALLALSLFTVPGALSAQAAAPPVGFIDVITFPLSIATQKLLPGQDTSNKGTP